MTQDPTPYDLLQDQAIEGLQEIITPYYTPPGEQEFSFPVVGQGVSSEMFQQISRAAGTGVYVQHDAEGAQSPYRLTGMPGGDSETNAQNTMMLRTPSVTGRSEAAIEGFFHTQLEDMPVSFPPVTTPTTYYLALTYDPRREEEEAGPIRIEVHANDLPTTHGRKHIVLYTVERQPSQLLTQATITRTLPWLGHVINVWYESDLPDPTTVEYGTLAVVINPGRAPGAGPGLYSCRGIHGWLNLQKGEWQGLGGFGGWTATNAMARYRNGGVDVTGFFVRDSNNTGNRHRPARLPEGLRPNRLVRGLFAHTSRPPYVLPIQVDTNGDITFYGSEVDGGWVGINAFIPDHYF